MPAIDTSAWTGYVPITVPAANVSAVIDAIPIRLSDLPVGFWSAVESDGKDLRWVNPAGDTAYPAHLLAFDYGGNDGMLWVSVSDRISTSTDTTWRLYAGNSGATAPGAGDALGRNAVWSDPAAIWLFNADPSGSAPQLVDVTGGGNNGTSGGTMIGDDLVNGKIWQGWDFDGTDDNASLGDVLDLGAGQDVTVSGWFKRAATGREGLLVKKAGHNTSNPGYEFELTGSDQLASGASDGTDQARVTGTTAINDTDWHHFAIVWDRDNAGGCAVYLDGSDDSATVDVSNAGGDINNVGDCGNSENLYLGASVGASDYFTGILSLLRVDLGLLTASEIATMHSSQNDPGTFYTVGSWTLNASEVSTGLTAGKRVLLLGT